MNDSKLVKSLKSFISRVSEEALKALYGTDIFKKLPNS